MRNGHLKSGHHQKWSPPKVVTKSGHQKWSPDQKLVTRSENEYRSEKYSNLGLAAEFDPKLDDFLNQTTKNKITSLD